MSTANVKVIAGQLFINCLGIAVLLQARPEMVLAHLKRSAPLSRNHAARAGTMLAYLVSLAGGLEFLLNPLGILHAYCKIHTACQLHARVPSPLLPLAVGQLSDIYGRKLFLMLAPVLTFLCKLAVWMSPQRFD